MGENCSSDTLAALAASASVGIETLSTDYWLWSAAPTHAYGLIVFVGLDAGADSWNMESVASQRSSGLVDGNDPTNSYARGRYPGSTCRHTRGSLQELPAR